MPRLLLVLGGALAALLLLPALPARAIVGGEVATSDVPHMAALEVRGEDGFSFACGASLVRPDVVLTAAHCVQDDPETSAREDQAAAYRLLLGTRDRTRGGERITANALVDHPDYDPESAANDVALLRLERASTLGTPIRIADGGDADRFEPGDEATITGWGATFSGGPPTAELREGKVPIVSDDTCARGYTVTASFDPPTMLCAGNATGGEDSCQGDSGGPLTVPDAAGRAVLVADVSFGTGCAVPTQYGVYGEVAGAALRPWVEARLSELSPGTAGPPRGGGPAAPDPAPEGGGDTPASTPAPRVRLPARLGSARRARAARRLRVLVRSSRPLRRLRVTLRRGDRVVAIGRRTSLRSRGRVVLRIRGRLRAGRATLRLTARDAAGRPVRIQRRVRLRR